MDGLSKAQTNETETNSLKSQENGLKSSLESLGKYSLSNGSTLLKENNDGMPLVDSQQVNKGQGHESANGLSSNNNKDDFSSELLEQDNFSGIDKDIVIKSDSETSSTLSSSSNESEDEWGYKELEKQVKESKSFNEQDNTQNATTSIEDKNKNCILSSDLNPQASQSTTFNNRDTTKNDTLSSEKLELSKKLEEASSKYEELKAEIKSIQKENNELKEILSAANGKNKNISDTTEDLKKINQALQEDLDNSNQQLQSKLAILSERDGTIEKLRSEISDLQSGKDSLQDDLQDAREKLNKLQSAQESEKLSNKQQEEKLDNLKALVGDQEQKIGELNVQLKMAKKEMEMYRHDKIEVSKRDASIEKLRSEIFDLQSSKDSLQTDLQDAREELKKLQENEELSAKQQKENFDNLKTKAEQQEQEVGKLTVQLEMAKKEIEMHGRDKSEVEDKLKDELGNAKDTIRSVNQANSKLEAKLSNSQTIIETAELESKKLKDEIKSLKDKIKWLEKRRASEKESNSKSSPKSETSMAEVMDKKLSQESQRRIQERVRELEQKVIQVNDEKQKLKHDYDEAVKALEAVDKVYSVRELALQQYKTDLEDANELLKQQSSEVQHLKLELDQLQTELKRIEENKEKDKVKQEELQEQLTKLKEANRIYKEEIEDVRKDLSDQVHELQMAQAKGRERGKRNQILELEVREIKESLLISKNVIEEKEKNMENFREDLRNEKKKCKTLQHELEELDYLNKKLQLIEDEKARIVGKLKKTESDLKETQENLKKTCSKIKEMEKEKETLNKNYHMVRNKCEDQDYEIQTLKEVVENKEGDIEQQLIELIHTRAQVDELSLQLQDMWASYCADKALWKNRGGRSIRRRYKSAPSKRIEQASPPLYQSPPEAKTHSLAHKRLVNKLGLPVVNPEYINTRHMDVPAVTQKQAQNNEIQDVPDSSPLPPNNNLKATDGTSQTPNGTKESPPKLSPRPPTKNIDRTRPHRPHYGVRTYPPTNGEHNRTLYDNALKEDLWLHMDSVSLTSGDTDEEVVKYLVNKGDRVMIQSKVVGEDSLNVSGVVKYVGKVGKKTDSPVYVGLKLDQPFGDNSGTVAGKQFFSCEPKHGKVIKMSEVNAVMHPRTKNYNRVKSMTLNW